ncbi:MAG: alpha/beta fold hydrolase [Rhodospirillaceae bacterium]|nr:alpha/beta fold hydrolase [Rhodospirillaceae bacterium]
MFSWVEANGVALRYELSGAGAETLVLIHEMGGALESWDLAMADLARERRVLRYDVRGAGMSEKVRGRLDIDAAADDLLALLGMLDLPMPVAVAGCAVGAAIAIRFAARHPQAISALIAMAPATGIPEARRAEVLARADRIEREGIRATALPGGSDDSRDAARCRRLAGDPGSLAATWRMLAGLEMDGDFRRVRCRSLVLAGSRDQARPPSMVETVANAIPGARFEVLETGHIMPLETPDLIARKINGFLTETRV